MQTYYNITDYIPLHLFYPSSMTLPFGNHQFLIFKRKYFAFFYNHCFQRSNFILVININIVYFADNLFLNVSSSALLYIVSFIKNEVSTKIP